MSNSSAIRRSHFWNNPLQLGIIVVFLAQIFAALGMGMCLFYGNYWTILAYGLVLILIMGIAVKIAKSFNQMAAQIQETTVVKLKASDDLWELALKASNDGIWDFNLATHEKFLSERCLEINGYEFSEIETIEQWLNLIHPEDRDIVTTAFQKHLNQEIPQYVAEYRFLCKNGDYKWLLDRGQAVRDESGKPLRVVGSTSDISDRKRVEAELRQSQSIFQSFFDNAPGIIIIKDLEGRYLLVNQEYVYLLQIPESEILGKTDFEFLPQEVAKNIRSQELQAIFEGIAVSFEQSLLFREQLRTFLITKFPILDEHDKPYAVAVIRLDISDRKQSEIALAEVEAELRQANLELQKLVNLDGLTKIANRRCFDQRIVDEWQRLHREQQPLSLLMFDVDYFKRYNDHYGHQLGDECLIKIAQTVEHLINRPADLLARYGGEEFIVILPNTNLVGALLVANHIGEAIKDLQIPHQDSDVSDFVTVSIGIVSDIPRTERSPHVLINQADQALYYAKQQGRNRAVIFQEE